MKTVRLDRHVGRRVLISLLVAGAMAGCHTRRVATDEPEVTLGWEDHRLSNSPRPYDKLLVEIDAVEGTEPSTRELAELRTFLEQATHKPGGITIKLDNIIPRAVAAQRSKNALALEYLNGPTDDRTSFLYVLFYRSKLGGLFVKPDQPYFTYFPYPCSIFIDRSYAGTLGLFYQTVFRSAILRHEVGHAMGLARSSSSSHCKGGHCTNAGCIMLPKINFRGRRFFTFRQPWENTSFCADCQRDLNDFKVAQPKPSERLWRGYFLRAGEGYRILTRPGFIYVHFGDAADLSESDVAEKRRAAFGDAHLHYTSTGVGFDPGVHVAALVRLLEENDIESIRSLMKGLLEKCASLAESTAAAEPDQARLIATEEMIAAAKAFPEVQARLETLRRKLATPDGPEK